MDLFDTLEKKQRFPFFNGGRENRYFLRYNVLLNNFSAYQSFTRFTKPYDVIRANIIIRAIQNKDALDETIVLAARNAKKEGLKGEDYNVYLKAAVGKKCAELPVFEKEDGTKIYIPILSEAINAIYTLHPEKLEHPPYSTLLKENGYESLLTDPFDTYGAALFDSTFTNWILLKKCPSFSAFFDYDSLSIYMINYQGRLDAKICLFDRSLKRRNTNHMLERITPVVDAYFREDRNGMMKALVDNQLISSKLIYKIQSDENKYYSRMIRD